MLVLDRIIPYLEKTSKRLALREEQIFKHVCDKEEDGDYDAFLAHVETLDLEGRIFDGEVFYRGLGA